MPKFHKYLNSIWMQVRGKITKNYELHKNIPIMGTKITQKNRDAPRNRIHNSICFVLYRALVQHTEIFTVNIFWEGYKILRNLLLTFDCMYYSGKISQNFVAFSEYMNFKTLAI